MTKQHRMVTFQEAAPQPEKDCPAILVDERQRWGKSSLSVEIGHPSHDYDFG